MHDPVFKRENKGLARRKPEDLEEIVPLYTFTTDIFLLGAVYGVAQSWTQLKGFSNIYIQCNKFLSMHFMHLTISMCVSECVILAASV